MTNKKRKKNFNLHKEYKESWSYIKESKTFIYAIITIFFIFAIIGFLLPAPDYLSKTILDFIKSLIEKTQGMSHLELIWFILSNNLQSSFFGMLFGIFFGIFPIIAIIANGYLLGFISAISVNSDGYLVLWRLLPHGVFELPAIFISLGLGLKLGTFIFQKDKGKAFREFLFKSLKAFFYIIIPLLIIAGIIEGTLLALSV